MPAIVRRAPLWLLLLAATGVPWACATLSGSSATQNRMRAHFEAASRIQTAIVQGDLSEARDPAEAIWAVDRLPELGPPAVPYVRRVQEHAGSIRDASIYGEAALATGRMAAACGDCHEAFGGGPSIRYDQAAPTGDGEAIGRHITRHVWAADRLWEGLIDRHETGWRLGAEILAEDALSGSSLSAVAQRHAARLQALGQEALETTDRTARGELYGRILSTCGACHAEAPGEIGG